MAHEDRRIEDQAVTALKEDVAEIKEGVKEMRDAIIGPIGKPKDGLAYRVGRTEEKVEDMEEAGVWDAINAEQSRKPWRKATIGLAVSLVGGVVFALVKLLQATMGG